MDESTSSVVEFIVTILALKVGKKQFTKQLFDQLPKMEFCGEGGRIREGVKPWGVVRLDGSRFGGWLVYEHEETLYRAQLIQARSQSEIERDKRKLEQDGYHSRLHMDLELKRLVDEPERAMHHAAMALLPQLFIGV